MSVECGVERAAVAVEDEEGGESLAGDDARHVHTADAADGLSVAIDGHPVADVGVGEGVVAIEVIDDIVLLGEVAELGDGPGEGRSSVAAFGDHELPGSGLVAVAHPDGGGFGDVVGSVHVADHADLGVVADGC